MLVLDDSEEEDDFLDDEDEDDDDDDHDDDVVFVDTSSRARSLCSYGGSLHSSLPRRPRPKRKSTSFKDRRVDPAGIYLGTWKWSGLPAEDANAVYGFRNRRGYVNRRISKKTVLKIVVQSGLHES